MIEMCSEYWEYIAIASAISFFVSAMLGLIFDRVGIGCIIGLIFVCVFAHAASLEKPTYKYYMDGYNAGTLEHNYTKLCACNAYLNVCNSEAGAKYTNETKYAYCNGYKRGYRDRSDQINVESAERNISMGEA